MKYRKQNPKRITPAKITPAVFFFPFIIKEVNMFMASGLEAEYRQDETDIMPKTIGVIKLCAKQRRL